MFDYTFVLGAGSPETECAYKYNRFADFQDAAKTCFRAIGQMDSSTVEAKQKKYRELKKLQTNIEDTLQKCSFNSFDLSKLSKLADRIGTVQRQLNSATKTLSRVYALTANSTHFTKQSTNLKQETPIKIDLKLNSDKMEDSFTSIEGLKTPFAQITALVTFVRQIKKEIRLVAKGLALLVAERAALIGKNETGNKDLIATKKKEISDLVVENKEANTSTINEKKAELDDLINKDTQALDLAIAAKNETLDDLQGKLQVVQEYSAKFPNEERIDATAKLQSVNPANSLLMKAFRENLDAEGANLAGVLLTSTNNKSSDIDGLSDLVDLLKDLLEARYKQNPTMSRADFVTKWPQKIAEVGGIQRKQLDLVSDLLQLQKETKENKNKDEAELVIFEYLLHLYDSTGAVRMDILSKAAQAKKLPYPRFYSESVKVLQSVNKWTGVYPSETFARTPALTIAPKSPVNASASLMIQSWAKGKPSGKEIQWVAHLLKQHLCKIFTAAQLDANKSLEDHLKPISAETGLFLGQLGSFIEKQLELAKFNDGEAGEKRLAETFAKLAKELIYNQNESLCATSLFSVLSRVESIKKSKDMIFLSTFLMPCDAKTQRTIKLIQKGVLCAPRLSDMLQKIEYQGDELARWPGEIKDLLKETCANVAKGDIQVVMKKSYKEILDFFNKNCSSAVSKEENRQKLLGFIEFAIGTESNIKAFPESVSDQHRVLSLYYGHASWKEMATKTDLIALIQAQQVAAPK